MEPTQFRQKSVADRAPCSQEKEYDGSGFVFRSGVLNSSVSVDQPAKRRGEEIGSFLRVAGGRSLAGDGSVMIPPD